MHDKLSREDLDAELALDEPIRARPIAPGRRATTSRIPYAARFPAVFRRAEAQPAGRRDGNGVAAGAEAAVERAAQRSSGAALPADVRRRFEDALGADLSGVRIHTTAESAAAASAIGARAYTTGQDIHFADGAYAPHDPFGLHLLAHEVAHTVQQAGGAPAHQNKLEVSTPGDRFEVEADRAADAMVAGQRAEVTGGPTVAARVDDPAATPAGPADPNAGADAEGGRVTVTVKYDEKAGPPIEFDAKDYMTLYGQVDARAQAGKEAGSVTRGAYTPAFSPGGGGKVTSVTFTVELTTSLPVWKQLSSQPKEHQDKFNSWLASIAAHEKGHSDRYKKSFDTLKTIVVGPDEAACNTQADGVATTAETDQDAWDKANQPAALPIPGGVQKIP